MERRSLFQALLGLVVAGNASAGSYEPQETGGSFTDIEAFCPVCGDRIAAAQTRKAEVAPTPDKDGWPTKNYEIMGVVYLHFGGKPPCDLPIQKVVPIKEPLEV